MIADEAAAEGAPSPCVKLCTVDRAARLCLGCGRTLDEITAWFTASAPQKRAILAAVARRQSDSVRSK